MTVSAVVICSVSNVSPALPTPQTHRHILTNLDLLLSSKAYTKQVYYYPFAGVGHVSLEDLGSGFKQSLSKALAEYPLLAGRICENGYKLEIDCNDKGVPFVLAVTDTSFSDWEGGVKNCPLERELVPSETYIKEYSEAPLIKAQLTRFKCGGVALGFVTSEIALDGFAAPEFVKSWSEIHRGLPLSRPPLFYTPLLEARSPPHVTITPSRDFRSSPVLSEDSATLNYKVFENTSMYINRVFSFSEEQVNKLVREVDTGPFSYGSASSFEALVALSWKAITEVRELPDSEVTTLNYAVSLRGKKVFNPPVPPNYFGNSAHIPCLPAKCSEVKTNHISYVARMLRQDINSFTTEYIKSSIDWMELELQKGNEIGFNCDLNSGKDINCTSLHTFPIYGADFGWGKPAHFSLLLHPWYGNGVVFVLPTPLGDRSRQVLVSLPAKQMKKLVAHELFAKFAS